MSEFYYILPLFNYMFSIRRFSLFQFEDINCVKRQLKWINKLKRNLFRWYYLILANKLLETNKLLTYDEYNLDDLPNISDNMCFYMPVTSPLFFFQSEKIESKLQDCMHEYFFYQCILLHRFVTFLFIYLNTFDYGKCKKKHHLFHLPWIWILIKDIIRQVSNTQNTSLQQKVIKKRKRIASI